MRRSAPGLHPAAVFGDVVHVDRASATRRSSRCSAGLITRTPTAALHVHVGMPDPATAILAFNGLRRHLPLLQALAANSPFWYGLDSGFDSARAQMFRAYPRSEIPPRRSAASTTTSASIEAIVSSAEIADYTFLWWDVRPHPLLGTVEVRAMDAQSDLDTVAALAALVHGLALHEARNPRPADDSGVLMESSFRAARDGLRATIWFDGALRARARGRRSARSRLARRQHRRARARGGRADPRATATAPTASARRSPAAGCPPSSPSSSPSSTARPAEAGARAAAARRSPHEHDLGGRPGLHARHADPVTIGRSLKNLRR